MNILVTLFLSINIAAMTSMGYIYQWEKAGLRFDIIQGFLKELVVDIMYDESNPLPGGAFAVSFSFNCKDLNGRELGCGIYIDNQWGGNKDEQYYFIPLDYKVIDSNTFKLSQNKKKKIITNKTAPTDWPYSSEPIKTLIKEMCKYDWRIRHNSNSYMGTSQWILERKDNPQKHKLYFNYMK